MTTHGTRVVAQYQKRRVFSALQSPAESDNRWHYVKGTRTLSFSKSVCVVQYTVVYIGATKRVELGWLLLLWNLWDGLRTNKRYQINHLLISPYP